MTPSAVILCAVLASSAATVALLAVAAWFLRRRLTKALADAEARGLQRLRAAELRAEARLAADESDKRNLLALAKGLTVASLRLEERLERLERLERRLP